MTNDQNWQTQQRRMLIAMREMRAKLDTLEKNQTEPIAIVGMGCRFPGGADNPQAFWQLLQDQVDAIAPVPPERWEMHQYYDPNPQTPGKMYTGQGGFLQQPLTTFAAEFFGISAQEAQRMNPQQLLLMEVVWEALEYAGVASEQLRGSQTGFFVGISTNEFDQQLQRVAPIDLDTNTILGNNQSITVGRIAFLLGLQGPTFQLDAACASSLLAVHLACQSLRDRECDLALSGGVNLILSPTASVQLCKIGALSPDGRCKTFDASADGYGRGEGCGIVVLKRLSDAIADRDNILALIRGSAVNHNGASSGLTTPNPQAQQSLMQKALVNAKVDPLHVSYIEAQGTGTRLGDAMEIGALAKVYGKNRPLDQPLLVGSAKTNIGHLEAAAGVAALIKVVLQLQHQEIPAHLHLQEFNTQVPWDKLPIAVPTSHQPWRQEQRLAGVSAFGFSGTNVHLIVEAAPQSDSDPSVSTERPLQLLTLSAKTPLALKQLCDRYRQQLSGDRQLTLENICFTANTGRSNFPHRLGIVAATVAELHQKLSAFTSTTAVTGVYTGEVTQTSRPKVVFVFGDQTSQRVGVAQQLYQTNPTFRGILDQCDEILRTHFDNSLIESLYPQDNQSTSPVPTAHTQAALFAVDYALAQVWRSWGVQPSAVIGQGVGDYVAACVAGVFSLEDGLKLIVTRDRLMSAILREEEQVADQLPMVSMESMLGEVEQILHQLSYSAPQITILTNATLPVTPAQLATPEYWRERLLHPEQLTPILERLQEKPYHIGVVIEPESQLLTMVRQSPWSQPYLWLPSLDPRQSNWQTLLDSLAQLYVRGVSVDWLGFDRDYRRHKVVLPTYPFERPSHAVVSPTSQTGRNVLDANLGITSYRNHPLLAQRLHIAGIQPICFQSQVSQHQPAYLKDYRVYNQAIAPPSLYIEMALAAAQDIYQSEHLILQDLVIEQAMVLPDYQPLTVQVILTPETTNGYTVQLFSHSPAETAAEPTWIRHACAKVLCAEPAPPTNSRDLSGLQTLCPQAVNVKNHYQSCQQHPINYGSSFQAIAHLWQGARKALAQIQLPSAELAQADEYILHPILLEASFQEFCTAFTKDGEIETYLPVGLKRLRVYRRSGSKIWSHIQINSTAKAGDPKTICADLDLMGEDGEIIAEIEELFLKPANYSDILGDMPQHFPVKSPTQIAQELQHQCSELMLQPQLINYWELLEHLESLSIDYILNALAEMNWEVQRGQEFTTTELSQHLGIVNQHQRLFSRLLAMLAEVGILEQNHHQLQVIQTPQTTDLQAKYNDLLTQYPLIQIELKLLHRCGTSLEQILRGTLNPLQLLFPEGDTTTAELYEKSPELKVMNTLVQQAVLSVLEESPPTTHVKLLEIGAGTGGTTSYVLPHLNPQQTEYIFTDIALLLMNQAQDKFKEYSFVSYKTLNIERDPSTQGFRQNDYDLIIAANVLHATKDLRQTLKHIKQLLATPGLLILLEGTRRQRWLDLIFGLTPGWWRFTDQDLRADHALLSRNSWHNLLLESGFSEVVVLPTSKQNQSLSSVQSIVIAQG